MENFNQLIPIDEGKGKKKTMTSLQIAEITGKTHSNVMRDIRNILEQLEDRRQFSFELSSRPQPMPNGGSKEVSCYILTKKDCLLLASGYDANLRAKIINRWEELEENKRELSRKDLALMVLQAEEEKERLALEVQRKEEEKQAIIEETKPAVVFTECVKNASTNILVRDLAKLITQNGYTIGEYRLYDWLVENKYLIRHKRWSRSKNKYLFDYTPTQRAAEMKLFFVTENAIMQGGNPTFIKHTCCVTGKGQVYFLNKFKSLAAV